VLLDTSGDRREIENASKTKSAKETHGNRERQTVGQSIIEGLKQAIAWTRGEDHDARVTIVGVLGHQQQCPLEAGLMQTNAGGCAIAVPETARL
jgi:hypothetical protein